MGMIVPDGLTGEDEPVPTPLAAALGSCPLTSFLMRAAALNPDGPALQDQPGREGWSGRQSSRRTYVEAVDAVGRLSSYLAGLGLPAGARVGICLPNGSEACLSLLAIESAGLTPCLLDLTAGASDTSRAIEAADIRAIVTQAKAGSERPAQKLCYVAAGFFRLRFLMAFGPDVPDGVIDLDAIMAGAGILARPRHVATGVDESGLVTFARRRGEITPVFRPSAALIAAALPVLAATGIRPGARVLSCLAGDDLKGLSTGLVPALVAGASFEPHGMFDSRLLRQALRERAGTHLVLPGWTERAFATARIEGDLESVTFVHDAPMRFGDGLPSGLTTVDVLAFGETAIVARARDGGGRFAIDLRSSENVGLASDLLDLGFAEDGEILFRGPAATTHAWASESDAVAESAPSGWIPSGFIADRNAGGVSGLP